VYSRRAFFAEVIYSARERIKNVLPGGPSLEYHLVTICLPAVLIALVAAALYIKERNKKP
jgi:hypothetical protein